MARKQGEPEKKPTPDALARLLASYAASDEAKARRLLREHPEAIRAKTSGTGETALHWCVIEQQQDAVAFLIAQGADVNQLDDLKYSALQYAVTHRDLTILKMLIAKGANPNTMSHLEETPLEDGIQAGQLEGVEVLLRAGAKVTYELHTAIELGDVKAVQLMLKYGADPSVRVHGRTAAEVAEAYGHVDVAALLKSVAAAAPSK